MIDNKTTTVVMMMDDDQEKNKEKIYEKTCTFFNCYTLEQTVRP